LGQCISSGEFNCDDGSVCTDDSCDAQFGCQFTPIEGDCDDGNDCTADDACGDGQCTGTTCGELELYCSEQGCVDVDCAAILSKNPDAESGNYWIKPDGNGPNTAFEVYCDMMTDGGGWTLVAVSSDDGQDTWTWNNRHYWDTDPTVFGTLTDKKKDYKSRALHELKFGDVLAVHSPSKVWASYHGVENNSVTLGEHIEMVDGPVCWQPEKGHKMSAGTLVEQDNLCSTELYFNVQDWDGEGGCGNGNQNDSYGPTWSVDVNGGCPFDDPGTNGSLGPSTGSNVPGPGGDIEYGSPLNLAVGFGWALDLNSGEPGTGENRMQVLVRRCTPSCDGKQCGNDDCGGVCGECGPGEECLSGVCSAFVLIPAGSFTMGTPDGSGNDPAETCRKADEGPQHQVTLTNEFYMKQTEVTQAEWNAVMGVDANPSSFKACGLDCPVETVTWVEAAEFCNELSKASGYEQCYVVEGDDVAWPKGYQCKGYRFPTEAEWEYAARAGTTTALYSGDISQCYCGAEPNLEEIGWYCGNSEVEYDGCSDQSEWGGAACIGTHPVAEKDPNPWNLYDMAGNVWDCCWDWYDKDYYAGSPAQNPTGPPEGTDRTSRGGSWYQGGPSGYGAYSCRSGDRHPTVPTMQSSALGIRPVRSGDCFPNCGGKECGNNGCGGNCGVCAPGQICFDGQCGKPPFHKWSVAFGGTKSDNSQSVAVDGDENSYLFGMYASQQLVVGDAIIGNAGGYDVLLVKLDPAGEVIWSHSFGGTKDEFSYALSLDSSSNVYVVGDYGSTSIDFGNGALENAGKNDIFLAKFDSSGAPIWSAAFGGEDHERGRAVAVSPNGGFYITGAYMSAAVDFGGNLLVNSGGDCGQVGCFDAFLAKFDSDGNHTWSRSIGGEDHDEGLSVAVDSEGNVYAAGRFYSEQVDLGGVLLVNAGKNDMFIMKMDANGEDLWATSFGAANDDNLYSMSVDTSGNVYLIGDFMSPTLDFGGAPLENAGDQDIFVVKLDTDGDHVFSRAYGGTGRDNGYSVAVDGSGMTYFTGYFGSLMIDFGGDALLKSGDKDLYLTKLDANGDHIWSEKYGGTGDEWGWVVQSGPAGNLWLSGCFRSPSIAFGDNPLTHFNNGQLCDIFLARFAQ